MRRLAIALLLAALLGGCSLGDDSSGRPPPAGRQARRRPGGREARLPRPAPPATRSGWRRAMRPPTPPAWRARSTPPPAASTARRPWCWSTRTTGSRRIAAAVLAGPPIGAPLLLSDGSDLPAVTPARPSTRLQPKGSDLSKDAQVIRIGDDVAPPGRLPHRGRAGRRPVRARRRDRPLLLGRARQALRRRGALLGRQRRVGDAGRRRGRRAPATPRCRSTTDSIPPAISRALRFPRAPDVYLLGPPSVISKSVESELRTRKLARSVTPHLRPHAGRERDRLRPLREGRLRLGHRGAGLQLRDRQRRPPARRGRRGVARHPRRLRAAAAHRRRRPAAAAAREPTC